MQEEFAQQNLLALLELNQQEQNREVLTSALQLQHKYVHHLVVYIAVRSHQLHREARIKLDLLLQ
jgi:hypothetical protein